MPTKLLRDTVSNQRRTVAYTIELPAEFERDPSLTSFPEAHYRIPGQRSPWIHIEAREWSRSDEELLVLLLHQNTKRIVTRRVLSGGVLLTLDDGGKELDVTVVRTDPAHATRPYRVVLECMVRWSDDPPITDFERARAWSERVCLSMTIVR